MVKAKTKTMKKSLTSAKKKETKLAKQLKAQKAKIKAQKAKMKKMNVPIWSKAKRAKKFGTKTSKPKVVKVDSYQTPKSRKSIKTDRKKKALAPGRRVSKSGKKYTEHRQNRSDKVKTRL